METGFQKKVTSALRQRCQEVSGHRSSLAAKTHGPGPPPSKCPLNDSCRGRSTSNDVDRSRAFYSGVLGGEVVLHWLGDQPSVAERQPFGKIP